MAVRDWHVGQVAVLWVVAAVVTASAWPWIQVDPVALAVLLVVDVPVLVLTWRWFGGQPKK